MVKTMSAGSAARPAPPARRERPSWLFLLRPKWLAWHAFAVLATAGMLYLGNWQLHRAEAGNELSWAYTFEWPIFAVGGVYFWVRTLREELRLAAAPAQVAESAAPDLAGTDPAPGAGPGTALAADTEAAETAHEAYVARLRAEVRRHGRWHGLR
jgi:hypothetical protein